LQDVLLRVGPQDQILQRGDVAMDEDLSIQIDNQRTLWLTEISQVTYEDQAHGGVFVVLEDAADGTFEVLGKAASIWAGQFLLALYARSIMRGSPELSLVE
jgi:hypothetical protein